MQTLVIYDNDGYLLSTSSGTPEPREPVGVPFLWVEVPQGQQIKITDGIVVDTSIEPHQVEFVDIPKTETELLKEKVQKQEEAIVELAELLSEVIE